MRRALLLAALLCTTPAAAAELPHSRLDIQLGLTTPQIRGSIETTFTNTSDVPLEELVLMLFPNRFAKPDAAVNDVTRPYVYPGQDFEPGWIDVAEVQVGGIVVPTLPLDATGLDPEWGVRVPLPAPLPPGATAFVRATFATHVPLRFGAFGAFREMLTALGGWYPALAALNLDGTWALGALPPLGDFEVSIAAEPRLDVILNGRILPGLAETRNASIARVHYVSLVAAPEFLREDIDTGTGRIVYLRRPPVLHDRVGFGDDQVETMRASLRRIIAERPAGVPLPSADLVVVEAPLRLDLTAPGEGMVVLSDRSLDVFWLLQPFHEAQMAQATYAELLRPALAERETAADYDWVSEGMSHQLARTYHARTQADTLSVQDWIELFNIFAIVDRFEIAPKIPFVGAFFERALSPDPLHQRLQTYNNDLPPGHVVFGKLRNQLGDVDYTRLFATCLAMPSAFRECSARESGEKLDAFYAQWLQPYPQIRYSVGPIERDEVAGEEETRVTILRQSSRPIHEPVEVEFRSIGGSKAKLRWDGEGDEGQLTARTPFRVFQVIIDPDRRLIESTRADNASPPEFQLILDTAEVQVSSTEFGVSALAVARRRGDYRKDLAAAGVYSNRGIGGTIGARYHWGEAIDPVFYRNNIYAFYAVQALDQSFVDDRSPDVRTAGHINGLGVRYDYNNILSYDNPTHEVQIQLFTDWFDRSLGSDYEFVDWGASMVLTHPLWSYRTILAGQVFNGFSEPLGSSLVPNQSLYSLGGSRSIRGIGAEDELGRNIFLLRAELRQTLYEELDLNMLDLLVLRQIQLRPFVDTGQVSNSAGAIYDPSGYAVGVGLGFGVIYDFMGFFPSIAYFEVATRVDRADDIGDVQFLFGTRQSF